MASTELKIEESSSPAETSSSPSDLTKTKAFEDTYRRDDPDGFRLSKFKSYVKTSAKDCDARDTLKRLFPIYNTFRYYKWKEDIFNDIIAGLTAGVMMIPQALAYGALTSLPPVTGLYVTFFASLTYVIFGTGKQLSCGNIAVIGVMMSKVVRKIDLAMKSEIDQANNDHMAGSVTVSNYSTTDGYGSITTIGSNSQNGSTTPGHFDPITDKKIEIVGAMTIICSIIFIIGSRIGLGRINSFLSDPVMAGVSLGLGFFIATTQLDEVLGVPSPQVSGIARLFKTWVALAKSLPQTHIPTLIFSIISILALYLVKKFVNEKFKRRLLMPVPIELIVMVIAIIVTKFAHIYDDYHIALVGKVPQGLPPPKFPNLSLGVNYIVDGLVLLIISHAQNMAIAKTLAKMNGYELDEKQELMTVGICSFVASIFSGYVSGISISRSIVQNGAGGRTQVASLFAVCLLLCFIYFLAPYVYYLPKCVLAAIVLVNLRSVIMAIFGLPKEWKKSPYDCSIIIFSCLAVMVFNIQSGLIACILFSLVTVLFRTSIVTVEESGYFRLSNNTIALRSLSGYPKATRVPNVKMIQVVTPLYYINVDTFTKDVLKLIRKNKSRSKYASDSYTEYDLENKKHDCVDKDQLIESINEEKIIPNGEDSLKSSLKASAKEFTPLFEIKAVVFDMGGVPFIDKMGVQALDNVIKDISSSGADVLLCNIPESVLGMLHSTGFWVEHADCLFLNIEAALNSIPYVTLK